MPYISRDRRTQVTTQARPAKGIHEPLDSGELAYQLAVVLEQYRALHGDRFQTFSDMLGALEAVKAEAYRRVVAKYEDGKLILNGDVYERVAEVSLGPIPVVADADVEHGTIRAEASIGPAPREVFADRLDAIDLNDE